MGLVQDPLVGFSSLLLVSPMTPNFFYGEVTVMCAGPDQSAAWPLHHMLHPPICLT